MWGGCVITGHGRVFLVGCIVRDSWDLAKTSVVVGRCCSVGEVGRAWGGEKELNGELGGEKKGLKSGRRERVK